MQTLIHHRKSGSSLIFDVDSNGQRTTNFSRISSYSSYFRVLYPFAWSSEGYICLFMDGLATVRLPPPVPHPPGSFLKLPKAADGSNRCATTRVIPSFRHPKLCTPSSSYKWALDSSSTSRTSSAWLPSSMALHLSSSLLSMRAECSMPSYSFPTQKIGFSSRFPPAPAGGFALSSYSSVKLKKRTFRACGVRCSLDTAIATVGQVTEVNKDNFWPIVRAAGEKTVVLDMYTQWYAADLSFFC